MDSTIPVIDRQGSMERLDNDEELWNEIRTIWIEDVPQMLRNVRDALEARNADGLRRAAHALKGASSNVGTVRVAEQARTIEATALEENWSIQAEHVAKLGEEVERALEVLALPPA